MEQPGEIGQRVEVKAEGFHRRRGYGGQEMLKAPAVARKLWPARKAEINPEIPFVYFACFAVWNPSRFAGIRG